MRPVRTLHEIFTKAEFQKLKIVKGSRTWHDFILELLKNEAV
ncbi:MAG: hypothetical protein P8X97_08330 [Candidatus Bathyarchaeota archaeon]